MHGLSCLVPGRGSHKVYVYFLPACLHTFLRADIFDFPMAFFPLVWPPERLECILYFCPHSRPIPCQLQPSHCPGSVCQLMGFPYDCILDGRCADHAPTSFFVDNQPNLQHAFSLVEQGFSLACSFFNSILFNCSFSGKRNFMDFIKFTSRPRHVLS